MARLVIDSGGLIALASKEVRAGAILDNVRNRGYDVCVPAVVVAETTRDASYDANINRILKKFRITETTEILARIAGKLLRESQVEDVNAELTIDAIVAAEAFYYRPSVVLTIDVDDMMSLLGTHHEVRILSSRAGS